MAISSERVLSAGAPAYRFLVRKQLALLAIGLIHAILIWNGDILVGYAMVGLAFLPFLRCRPRTLLVVAVLGVIAFMLPHLPDFPTFTPASRPPRSATQLSAFQHGTWLQVHAQQMADLKFIYHYIAVHWWPPQLSAFCLGAAVWYSGLLKAPEKAPPRALVRAAPGVVSLAVICGSRVGILPRWRSVRPVLRPVLQFSYVLAYFGLAFAYGAGILLLLQTSRCGDGCSWWRARADVAQAII